jgi:hypothetical protein
MELPGLAAVTRDPEPGTGWAPVGAPAREPVVAPTPERKPEAAPAPAPLVAEASEEANVALAETLDAQTPLLKRAFRNVALPDDSS